MNKELLIKTGEAAFGANWQTDLAKKLEVSARSIRYWVSGERQVPSIEKELISVLENRKSEIDGSIKTLSGMDVKGSFGCYKIGDVDFYATKEQAMSNTLLHLRPSKTKDLALIPYFCCINVVNTVDGQRFDEHIYAVKFMEKLQTREFNNERLSAVAYWTAYEFDEAQAGVITYQKLKFIE